MGVCVAGVNVKGEYRIWFPGSQPGGGGGTHIHVYVQYRYVPR